MFQGKDRRSKNEAIRAAVLWAAISFCIYELILSGFNLSWEPVACAVFGLIMGLVAYKLGPSNPSSPLWRRRLRWMVHSPKVFFRRAPFRVASQTIHKPSLSPGELAAFVGGSAHNINNVMTGILGAISLLSRAVDRGDIAAQRKLLQTVRVAADKCSAITRQLLCLARIQRDKAVLSPINVGTTINEVVSTLSMLEAAFKHRISVVLPDTVPFAYCDEYGLNQVLTNLGMNALDSLDGPGLVTFEVSEKADEEYLEICVRDSGCGMTPEIMSSMFEPFFTTKHAGSGSTKLGGTGLGLSTVRYIVESWAGSLSCDSAPGRGTTFRILIPKYVPSKLRHTVRQDFTTSSN